MSGEAKMLTLYFTQFKLPQAAVPSLLKEYLASSALVNDKLKLLVGLGTGVAVLKLLPENSSQVVPVLL